MANSLIQQVGAQCENRWCSWCLFKTRHAVVEKKTFARDVCQCQNCVEYTSKCTFIGCKGMAKVHSDWSDNLCAIHDRTIKQWPTGKHSASEVKLVTAETGKWCSWCFNKSDHYLQKSNLLSRNVLNCSRCHNRTLKCRMCKFAMTRGHGGWDDELCAKCDHTITDWQNALTEIEHRAKVSWCSWCFTKSSHEHVQKNFLGRNISQCMCCEGRTLRCITCRTAMARGGFGWDDFTCARCEPKVVHNTNVRPALMDANGKLETLYDQHDHIEKKLSRWVLKDHEHHLECKVASAAVVPKRKEWDWEDLRMRNCNIFAAQRCFNLNLKNVFEQESEYRRRAYEEGLLRPFLLLVSMDPAVRLTCACLLGFSYLSEDYFGDPHAEAWAVLYDPVYGLRKRGAGLLDGAHSGNWYSVLHKVATAVMFCDEEETSPIDALKHSCDKNSPVVGMLETEVLRRLAVLQQKTVDRDILSKLESIFIKIIPNSTTTTDEHGIVDEFCGGVPNSAYDDEQEYIRKKFIHNIANAGLKQSKTLAYALQTVHHMASIASDDVSPDVPQLPQGCELTGSALKALAKERTQKLNEREQQDDECDDSVALHCVAEFIGKEATLDLSTVEVEFGTCKKTREGHSGGSGTPLGVIAWLWRGLETNAFASTSATFSSNRLFPAIVLLLNQKLLLASQGWILEDLYPHYDATAVAQPAAVKHACPPRETILALEQGVAM